MPKITATKHILMIIVAYWKKKIKQISHLIKILFKKKERLKELERGGIHGFKVRLRFNSRLKCDGIITI